MSILFKSEYTPKSCCLIGQYFNSLAYDWTLNVNEMLPDMTPNWMLFDVRVSSERKCEKKMQQTSNFN